MPVRFAGIDDERGVWPLDNNAEQGSSITGISIAVALFALVGSVAYIVYRLTSAKAYKEKWEYYEDCGI